MKEIEINTIHKKVKELSSNFNKNIKDTAIILAAGHGKRIKSQRSKMLHNIWGIPTVERVFNAACNGLGKVNFVIVVGIKALDVIDVIGKRENTLFAYQSEQKGTGHAVQVALDSISNSYDGTIYVLPGDMGLLDSDTMENFRQEFLNSSSDMMVLTGIYEGDCSKNSYGRILRVKQTADDGTDSGSETGNVIEILEHKDILAIKDENVYQTEYKGKKYSFTKKELLENREFNSGVYAFDSKKLFELVYSITSDNAQNEIYITDLISLFNKKGYSVSAVSPQEQCVVMGFNDKSVLKEMENIYRDKIYDKLKNIIDIQDPEDFYIHESVVENIIEMDKDEIPLDIKIGKGVYIGKGVKLNYNLELKKNVYVNGNVKFGKFNTISENVYLSTFPEQEFILKDNVKILWGDIIKGNIIIGEGTTIESSVNMTGSDEYPLRIGNNVLIKGTSYIFGSIIEDDVHIEHSVIIKKKVRRVINNDGKVQPVKFFLPIPMGMDAIEDLK